MISYLPAILAMMLVLLNLLSFVLVTIRCRPGLPALAPENTPPISIIRPIAGIENYLEEMLRSNFEIDYPDFELLICFHRSDDPAIALAKNMIAAYPNVDARILIGDENVSSNPKLNNLSKGLALARHELVVFVDSNVLMPRDFVQQLLKQLRPGIVATFSPPIGTRPESFWAEVECAFLNSFQARILYTADVLGLSPIQGKAMLIRRSFLEEVGGIRALACDLAEDIALRRSILGAGARSGIVDAPFRQPLGWRSAHEVLQRQRRWALLRRQGAPTLYPFELLLSGLVLALLAGLSALTLNLNPWIIALCAGATIYAAECVFAWYKGWFNAWFTPLAFLLRDALLPLIWLLGLLDRGYEWRGSQVRLGAEGARIIRDAS